MAQICDMQGLDNKLLSADDILMIANNKQFLLDKEKQLEEALQKQQSKLEDDFAATCLSIHKQLEEQLNEVLADVERRALSSIKKIVQQLHIESIAPEYMLSLIQEELNSFRDSDNTVIVTCHKDYLDVLEKKLRHDGFTVVYNSYDGSNKHMVFIENKYLKTKFDINIFLNSTEELIENMQQDLMLKKNSNQE